MGGGNNHNWGDNRSQWDPLFTHLLLPDIPQFYKFGAGNPSITGTGTEGRVRKDFARHGVGWKCWDFNAQKHGGNRRAKGWRIRSTRNAISKCITQCSRGKEIREAKIGGEGWKLSKMWEEDWWKGFRKMWWSRTVNWKNQSMTFSFHLSFCLHTCSFH